MPTKIITWSQPVYFSAEVELTEEELLELQKCSSLTAGINKDLFEKLNKDKQQDDVENEMNDIMIE